MNLLLGIVLFLQGVQIPSPPRGFSPSEADMVVDAAGVLSPDARARMNRAIFAVKQASGGEIVVVTMPDVSGREAGDIALQIGREWRLGANAAIGDRARNAGVVVLLVPKEGASDGRGQIAIQTGQGAEGFITDGIAGTIRREATGYLREADYSTGLELITQRVAERYATEFGFSLDSALLNPRFGRAPAPNASTQGIPPAFLLLFFIILMLVLMSMARRRGGHGGVVAGDPYRRRRPDHTIWWGGGGFGGGSWGGGGGGFGGFGGGGGFSGGGSSGSW